MKNRFIEWAELNLDKANSLQIANNGLGNLNLDEMIHHFLTTHNGNLDDAVNIISKSTTSIINN